jgi:hypothetical protein
MKEIATLAHEKAAGRESLNQVGVLNDGKERAITSELSHIDAIVRISDPNL